MLGRIGMRRLGASILALLLSLSTAVTANAQAGVTITGTVKSEAGQPLYGANVTIEALTISVGTSEDGRYTITVPGARVRGQQVVLRTRAIGYVPVVKTITLNAGSQTHDFELKQDVNRLSQVVVTGVTAGTEIKKLPFTVAQVSAEDMPVPGSNPLTQLQGKVPGANIVSASGRPGTAPAVILRGPQSINAEGRGQGPLVIVDGVISQGDLQDINPQDIESVEVVKGAAAASLYGSRAGNGVIQITTRSGKNVGEGVRFRSNFEYGTAEVENEYEYPRTHFALMDASNTRFCVNEPGVAACGRSVDIQQEAFRINDQGGDFALQPKQFINDGGISLPPGAINSRGLYQSNRFPVAYNPIRQVLSRGQTYNSTVDATGRVGRTTFFASANQFRQEGALRFMKGYTRNSFRVNVDQTMASNFSFAVRTNYTAANDFNSGGSFFRVSRQPAAANLTARDSRGRLYIRSVVFNQGAQNENPAYNAEAFQPNNEIGRYLGQATARWQPFTWMDAEANFGFDGRTNHQFSQQDRGYRATNTSLVTTPLGTNSRSTNNDNSLNASADVTMRRDWFDNQLNSRLSFRYLFEAQRNRGFNAEGDNIVVPGLRDPNATIQNFEYGGNSSDVRQVGAFVNLDLDYKGRYILGGLVRRDGASLFGASQRWKTYGRGSFAWRISEEPWFAVDQISDLKFRASLGQAGNRPNFSAQYETFTIGAGGALNPQQVGNANLRPEVATEREIGFDVEFMNRYALTVTQANNVVNDQILPVPPSASAGALTQWLNAGQLTNNTFEVSLNVPILQGRNLSWSTRILYDRTTSEITRLDRPEYFQGGDGFNIFKITEGGGLGDMYGKEFMKSCSDMPTAFQSRCGPGREFQKNDNGLIVYTGAGNELGDGIKKNLWFTTIPAVDHPYGIASQNWGMPIHIRDAAGAIALNKLGSALPDFRWSNSHNVSYGKWTGFVLVDATVGKVIFNQPRQWSFGDFMSRTTDQSNATVETAKPLGYYWRASPQAGGSGIGGLYDVLGANNITVEDGSFVKLREMSIGYRVGALAGFGDWNLSFIGRNLFTISGYQGFDPEVGDTDGQFGSAALLAVDGYGFPNLRTFTFMIGTSF